MQTETVEKLETSTRQLLQYQNEVVDGCTIIRKHYKALLDNLDSGSVDLLLTDPPYAISRDTGFAQVGNGGVDRFAVSMDFGHWDKAEIDHAQFAKSAYGALRKGGTAIVWYDLWKITTLATALQAAGFRMLRTIIWQKTNPVPLNSKRAYLTNSREIAVVAVKGSNPTFNSEYDNGVYRDLVYEQPIPRHSGKKIHPTQKPIALFNDLVEKHSNSGDLVVDPFLGSGTTAIAAITQGRRFYGGDIESKYVKAAQKRAKNEPNK